MEKRVIRFIRKYNMIEPDDKVLVGFSGGADSLCLLLILKNIIGMPIFKGASLGAVYIEHGIRGEESFADGEFARKVCEREGIPFELISVDAPAFAENEHISLEEAARVKRYEALEGERRRIGAKKIAVAHHADDCAETVLFNLARGTGISGMAGISPVHGSIIRPLICCTRDEILAYLKERGESFRVDSTNADMSFARNRIRNVIIPELCAVNSAAQRHITDAAGEAREISEYIEEKTLEAKKDCALNETTLDSKKLAACPAFISGRVILDMAGELIGRRDISRAHIDAALGLIGAGSGRQVDFPRGLVVRKEKGKLLFRKSAGAAE